MNETNATSVAMPPIYYDVPIMSLSVTLAQIAYRLSVVGVGILLNGVVFLTVTCSRQLRYPRHVFWAAIALVDCLFLAQCVLELAVIVNHHHLACMLNVILAFTDYSILLLFLFLTAVDRYVAIVRYERYKRSVTNGATIKLLSCASIFTFVIVTSPFWTGYRSVHTCTINLAQMFWVFAWNSLLGICCVVLHVTIFIKSKTIIRKYFPNHRTTPITLKFVNSQMRLADHNSGIVRGERQPTKVAPTSGVAIEKPTSLDQSRCEKVDLHGNDRNVPHPMQHIDNECFPWTQNRSIVNRMEARAAVRMSVNLLPIWLCTFPISFISIAIYWCIRFDGNCQLLGQIMSYLRDLFLLHSIYNPVMYMCTSSEFCRALRHIAWKFTNGCHVRTK